MALPTKQILLRSPYWVTREDSELQYIIVDLKIWTGDLTADEPINPNIRLRATALDGNASVDISEFARDYVEVTFNGEADSNAVWMSYTLSYFNNEDELPTGVLPTEYLVGMDGYSVFQDGINYQWYKEVLMNSDRATAYNESNIKIPVLQDHLTGYELQKMNYSAYGQWGTFHETTGLTPTEDTDSIVKYVSSSYSGNYAGRIIFHFDGVPDETIYIDYQDCTKFGLTNLYFVNRLGALQEIHFSGRFDVQMEVESDSYKRNILVNGNYSDTRHQKYTLNKNGKIMMTLNTGWMSEDENDTILEQMLSEQVWIRIDVARLGKGWLPKQSPSYVVPVILNTENITIKNKFNDKLINYTFRFEAAHDWINTVR